MAAYRFFVGTLLAIICFQVSSVEANIGKEKRKVIEDAEGVGLSKEAAILDHVNAKPSEVEVEDIVDALLDNSRSKEDLLFAKQRYVTKQKLPNSIIKDARRLVNSVMDVGEQSHHRGKRSHIGEGIPHAFGFELKAFQPSEFKIGSVLSYQCTISASTAETDVLLEIFSEVTGFPYFMISNVRISHVGSNLETFSSPDTEVLYYSTYNTGRYDYAKLHLGKIFSSASDLETVSANQIVVLFDALALSHETLVDGERYSIGIGVVYGSETMQMSQDQLAYDSLIDKQESWIYDHFDIEGPDSLIVGETGVWAVTAAINDLQCELSLDVLAPISLAGVLSIDSISISYIGENFKHNINDDTLNLTRFQYDGYGDFARADVGTIINSGYHSHDYELARNTLKLEVAVTILDHNVNDTGYNLGFILWKGGGDNAAIAYSALMSLQAVVAEFPPLVVSQEVTIRSSVEVVPLLGRFGILVNISVPMLSTTNYEVEVSVPVVSAEATVDLERIRVAKIGSNLPHFEHMPNVSTSSSKTYGEHTDSISINLGTFSNTGQRDTADSNIIQVEIACRLLESAINTYGVGSSLPITVGVAVSDDQHWVGITEIEVSDSVPSYSASQVPTFTFVNVMGLDAKLYRESAAVFDLDVVIPPGFAYETFMVEIDSSGGSDAYTSVKIVDSQVTHIGNSVLFDEHDLTYSGLPDDVESNGDEVYNTVTWTLKHLTNLRDRDSARYEFEESTLRIRTVVIARERAFVEGNLVEGEIQWVDASVDLDEHYMLTTSAGLIFADTVNMYDGNHWQPGIDLQLADGYSTDSVGLGGQLKYNLAINLPYRTSTSIRVKAQSTTSPVQICQVALKGSGAAVLDYLPPLHTGVERIYDAVSRRMLTSYNILPAATSYSYENYIDDITDSYINYTVVVMLNTDALVGETYQFDVELDLGFLGLTPWSPQIITSADVPTVDVQPMFDLTHQMGTNTINVGGSEVFYFDLYIPPETAYKYEVRLIVPRNISQFGEYEILEAFIVSAGADLACFNAWTTDVSTPNTGTTNNLAVFSIGYVPNIAVGKLSPSSENRLRLAILVALAINTTLPVGSNIPISASVTINGEAERWIGGLDVEIIPPEDERNVVPPSNLTVFISAESDMMYSVGETQLYDAVMNLPPGMAVTEFQVVVESPLVDGEALFTVTQPILTHFGSNLLEAEKYHEFSENETDFMHLYRHQLEFGFVRNLDRSGISDFINRTYDGENQIKFQFSLRLMDHKNLSDAHQFDMIVNITCGTEVVSAMGDITVTVSAPDEDTTIYDWDVYFIPDQAPTDVVYDSVISFGLDLGINPESKRFPDDLRVLYRVPAFSTLVPGSVSFSGLESAFSHSTEVNQQGLQFFWNRLRYGNDAQVNFSITVDPDKYLEFGLLSKYISVPVDIQYFEEDKTSHGNFNELFSSAKVLEFELTIPECLGALGMADDTILDCQISASIEDADYAAVDARADGSSGWVTIDRGPPYYQHEYLQIDLGHTVRISGVTIQPFNDADAHRITSFKVQQSWRGIHWEYITESDIEKVFDVVWTEPVSSSSSVLVEFGTLAFLTRYIRILPQENAESSYIHRLRLELVGCPWPYKTVPSAYECAAAPDPVKSYSERQMLAFDENICVCVMSETNSLPYCSGSNDFGDTWSAIDDNVMNMLGYEKTTAAVYALARNRQTTLRSTDKGHTWAMVEESDFATMSAMSTYIQSTALPFPLQGDSTQDRYTNYGYTDEITHTWSVSDQALHAYPTNSEGVSILTTSDHKVAQWGSTEWNNP